MRINGKVSARFTEHLPTKKRLPPGMLQLQLHDSDMIAEFRHIRLKRLP